MKLLKQDKERAWYLVKEWRTRAGLLARVHQCKWGELVHNTAPSLHDFYTGYVQVPEGMELKDTENTLEAHGGITFGYPTPSKLPIEGADGLWVGFDMAHLGDETNQDLAYAVEECEKLAEQIVSLPSKTRPIKKKKK